MTARISAALLFALAGIQACGDDGNKGTTGADTSVPDTAATDTAAIDTAVAPDTVEDTAPDAVACGVGDPCDDGDPCTKDDRCDAAGACHGAAKCDDGLACTNDSCAADGQCTNAVVAGFCLGGDANVCVSVGGKDPANTCRQCAAGASWSTLADGVGCNDGDLCTTADKCQAGACVGGAPLACPSDTPCVSRACDSALGCVDTNTTAACDDHDPCTTGDTCKDGACQTGTGTLACDDDNPCTIDSCQPGVGCVFDAHSKCDDHQPCTADSCDESNGACSNTLIPAGDSCDDLDPCTTGETCNEAHACQGGAPTVCDDQNECTLDTCASDQGGCLYLFVDKPCDDGFACTFDDQCVAGSCFGAKNTQLCGICELNGDLHANKIVSLELMSDGNAGSGLDVDHDPGTCAPEGSCAAGVDNELSLLASLMNPAMSDSIEGGVVKWVADLSHAKLDGTPFGFSIYDSGLSDNSAAVGCDYQVDTCAYDVAQLSFGPDCAPYFHLEGMTIANGVMKGGGDGQLISMVLPLAGGALLSVTIANAQVEATVTLDAQNHITSMNGIVAGAIPKAQLIAAVEGLDPDSLPIDKEAALQLLDILVVADIDLDGDGLDEAASLGMRFRTIPAIINPVVAN